MRYDSEHKQQTRQRVLKAAARAIRAEGPHRVGVAGIMRKAGLTHGGFYAHFPSKDAMVTAAIEQMFDESRQRWENETAGRPPAEALVAYIDFYLSPAHRDARTAGCPMAALSSDLRRLSPPCRDAFASGARGLMAHIARQLQQLGHADAAALAGSVVSELIGALSLARGEPDRERSDALLAGSRHSIKQRLGLEHVEEHA